VPTESATVLVLVLGKLNRVGMRGYELEVFSFVEPCIVSSSRYLTDFSG
jgi:hypothetical protein